MSWYVYHSLELMDKDQNLIEDEQQEKFHTEEISDLHGFEEGYLFGNETNGGIDTGKVQEYSKKYPEILFKIYGKDDETEYFVYFMNGRVQQCNSTVVFEEFNENNWED